MKYVGRSAGAAHMAGVRGGVVEEDTAAVAVAGLVAGGFHRAFSGSVDSRSEAGG